MEVDQLEVFCVIDGEYKLFPIKIPSSESVGILKNKIKDKTKNTLANFDAHQLHLYYVEIPKFDEMTKGAREQVINQKLSEHPELGVRKKLADIFPNGVKEEMLIIVQAPDSGTN